MHFACHKAQSDKIECLVHHRKSTFAQQREKCVSVMQNACSLVLHESKDVPSSVTRQTISQRRQRDCNPRLQSIWVDLYPLLDADFRLIKLERIVLTPEGGVLTPKKAALTPQGDVLTPKGFGLTPEVCAHTRRDGDIAFCSGVTGRLYSQLKELHSHLKESCSHLKDWYSHLKQFSRVIYCDYWRLKEIPGERQSEPQRQKVQVLYMNKDHVCIILCNKQQMTFLLSAESDSCERDWRYLFEWAAGTSPNKDSTYKSTKKQPKRS